MKSWKPQDYWSLAVALFGIYCYSRVFFHDKFMAYQILAVWAMILFVDFGKITRR